MKPIDKINIGYNKNNEEYIDLLEERNKIKKEREKSREHQTKKKVQEKEANFNIYLNGANEDRIKEQKKKELLSNQQRSISIDGQAYTNPSQQQQQQNQKVRRQWKASGSVEERKSIEESESSNKYTNPVTLPQQYAQFDLGVRSSKQKEEKQQRKKWGQNLPPTGKKEQQQKMHDEDDYSDSFEEPIQEDESLQQQNFSPEQQQYIEVIEEPPEENEIQQFLRTATMKDILSLRQSMSQIGEFSKGYNQPSKGKAKEDDTEYIEEEFEDPVDSEDSDSKQEEEKQRLEQLKQQELLKKQQQAATSHNKTGRTRPISATFNLAQQKVQTQRNETQSNIGGSSQLSQMGLYQKEEQKLKISSQAPIASGFSSIPKSQYVQETPKQPNDKMKKPINTNPFKRPFSHQVPKKPDSTDISSSQQSLGNKTVEGSYSNPKDEFKTILNRIDRLEDWQKEKLLEVLNNLESLSSSQVSSQLSQSAANQSKNILSNAGQQIDLKFLSPTKNATEPQTTKGYNIDKSKTQLTIRVMNTYGNPHLCGLTEIEVFDEYGKKIPVVPACIVPQNLGKGPKMLVNRMVNGIKLTNDEKNMWIGYLPLQPQHLELVLNMKKDLVIGGLKLWNYNKSAFDCTKGVKDFQVLLNNEVVYSGTMNSGKGQVNVEYATFVVLAGLKEGVQLPREIPIAKTELSEEPIEEACEEEDETKDNIHSGEMPEELRKYRSELNMKKRPESTPFWLATEKKQQAEPSAQEMKDKRSNRRRQGDAAQNTADLLDKFQKEKDNFQIGEGRMGIAHSAVGGARTKLQDPMGFQGGPIKPNAALGSITTKNQTKPYEMASKMPQTEKPSQISPFLQNAQYQQQTQQMNKGQVQETTDAIKQAVNKVNQLMSGQPQKGGQRQQPKVEDSLDNLDYFKATNRGRLLMENEANVKQAYQQPERSSKQSKWQASPGKDMLQESSHSAKKSAHVIVKNPFPEKVTMKQSQPTTQRKGVQFYDEGGDALDQFLSEAQNPKNVKTVRNAQIQDINNPYEPLTIHHLQVKPDNTKQLQKQSSYSPMRDDIKTDHKKPSQGVFQSYESKISSFSESFFIPNLPMGQKLEFNLLSTWGDMNYVGLAGIELFDIEGQAIEIDAESIRACPPDINILPGNGGDPRTVDKLVDGHHFTNDDMHVWLTPFTAGEDHTISIDLGKKYQISMLRIWNYNKSRIHSYRGARLVTCALDDKTIFRGEISKAPGNLNDPENCCEIILFTDNDAILSRIDSNDWVNEKTVLSDLEDTQRIMQDIPSFFEERPMTATKKFNTAEIQEIQRQLMQQKPQSLFDSRPQTSAIITSDQAESKYHQYSNKSEQQLSQQVKQIVKPMESKIINGRIIEFNIIETWGDFFYVGLTGIEVIDERGQAINIKVSQVEANPRDMNSIPGYQADHRTLEKLFDRVNNTTDDHHMWLIPFNKGENHTIKIDLGKTTAISAIRFYNYNKSEEDTLRGVKQVVIQVDKKYMTPKKGVTVRKAPGLVHPLMDLGHTIQIPYKQGWTTDQIIPMQRKVQELGIFQEYELMNLPMGYLLRINLYSTHGDFYYIGLNGIEVYDQNGCLIHLKQIFAQPLGVHTLPGMEGDKRVAMNLIDGVNKTHDDTHMWLAPFKNTRSYNALTAAVQQKDPQVEQDYRVPNYIYVLFEQPQPISAIRLWNYSKTPSRGVNEFEVLFDDKQIYRGFAKKYPQQGIDAISSDTPCTAVLFTSDIRIVDNFKAEVNYDTRKQQTVALVNEKKIMNKLQQRPSEEFVFNEMQRPTTMAR